MKILMLVFNTLDTDARVQRAATALTTVGEVMLVGIDKKSDLDFVKSSVIKLITKQNLFRYYEFCYKVKKIIRENKFDILYAHDFYTAELAVWVKKKYPKVKLVYDAHELYIPQEGQFWSKRFDFFYKKEKRAIACADLIVAANKERAEIMKKHYGLASTPIVVRNISILPLLNDNFSKCLLEKTNDFFQLKGITLVYAGVITASRKIEKLIDIVEKSSNSKLLIIGGGADLERIQVLGRKKLGNRIFLTGGIPYAYLSTLLKNCDIGFMSYPVDTLNNIYCAPNKIYEYASVGLPMISNENPTVKAILEENKIGSVSDNLSLAFEKVANNIDEYKKNCFIFCKENNWESEAKILAQYVGRLI